MENKEITKEEYITRLRQLMNKPNNIFNYDLKTEVAEAVYEVSTKKPELVLNIDSLITSDTFHDDIKPSRKKLVNKEDKSNWSGGFSIFAK